jgi:hypothetical protein
MKTGGNAEKVRTFVRIEGCLCIRVIAEDLKMDEVKASIRKRQG